MAVGRAEGEVPGYGCGPLGFAGGSESPIIPVCGQGGKIGAGQNTESPNGDGRNEADERRP